MEISEHTVERPLITKIAYISLVHTSKLKLFQVRKLFVKVSLLAYRYNQVLP